MEKFIANDGRCIYYKVIDNYSEKPVIRKGVEKIGRFIAKLRKEQKMTQFDLATKIGVTDRAVSKWENGRGLPDISLISALCEALEISIDELLEGERIEDSEKLKIARKNLFHF